MVTRGHDRFIDTCNKDQFSFSIKTVDIFKLVYTLIIVSIKYSKYSTVCLIFILV